MITETRRLETSLRMVRPFTMVHEESLEDLAQQVRAVLRRGIPGDFVECGVWRGGAAFLIASILRDAGITNRKVWLFDSFEGLPPPQAIDGVNAQRVASDPSGYFDNCRSQLEDVQETARQLGVDSLTEFVKGWFVDTLPAHRERIGPIAILRVDADWYDSVRCCLDNLYDQVVADGFVVFDDYYSYDGCAIAVHEFLGSRRIHHRLEGLKCSSEGGRDHLNLTFRKGAETWAQAKALDLTEQEIASVVPSGETFILVDQDQLGQAIAPGRTVVPFLESDGQYWGPPEDDATAIREFERLRQRGARFIVFAWPAFWWLTHYARFASYLRDNFPCTIESSRVVGFDLRATRHSK